MEVSELTRLAISGASNEARTKALEDVVDYCLARAAGLRQGAEQTEGKDKSVLLSRADEAQSLGHVFARMRNWKL